MITNYKRIMYYYLQITIIRSDKTNERKKTISIKIY